MKLFIESFQCRYPTLRLTGWRKESLESAPIQVKLNGIPIESETTSFEREDGDPLDPIQGLNILIPIQPLLLSSDSILTLTLYHPQTEAIWSPTALSLNNYLNPTNDFFIERIQNPATCISDQGLRLLSAKSFYRNSASPENQAMSLVLLAYRMLEFNIADLTIIGIDPIAPRELLNILERQVSPESSRWLICLLQVLAILAIRDGDLRTAEDLADRAMNYRPMNSLWPSLSTNIMYLVLLKSLFIARSGHPIPKTIPLLAKQLLITHLTQWPFDFPANYDEFGNSVVVGRWLKRMDVDQTQNITELGFIKTKELTHNWRLVSNELKLIFGLG